MDIEEYKDNVIAYFRDERGRGSHWVQHAIGERGEVTVAKVFNIKKKHIIDELSEDDVVAIKIGKIDGDYWRMDGEVMDIAYDLFLGRKNEWRRKHFIAEKGVGIFSQLNKIVSGEVRIGGTMKSAIPFSLYDSLIRKIPNYYELQLYVKSRLSSVVGEFFNVEAESQKAYKKYLNNKIGKAVAAVPREMAESEAVKFEYLIAKMTEMLKNVDGFSEDKWQKEIILIIRFLFPKYIAVLDKIQIKDLSGKRREIDIGLLDVEGNLDIIEIKRPFSECIMSSSVYRDNYIPLRELSGTIMQIEKYILYLQRGGITMDEKIQLANVRKIPRGMKVNVVNPRGLIIMGRSDNLSIGQKADFEIVKRKYKNVVDIITYDDLLNRLNVLKDSVRNFM